MSDAWKFKYFTDLIALRNIYATGMTSKYPQLKEYVKSAKFFDRFADMLYENSSGVISEFVNDPDEQDYNEYILKKNQEHI